MRWRERHAHDVLQLFGRVRPRSKRAACSATGTARETRAGGRSGVAAEHCGTRVSGGSGMVGGGRSGSTASRGRQMISQPAPRPARAAGEHAARAARETGRRIQPCADNRSVHIGAARPMRLQATARRCAAALAAVNGVEPVSALAFRMVPDFARSGRARVETSWAGSHGRPALRRPLAVLGEAAGHETMLDAAGSRLHTA